jgi:hypothetical protein
VLDLAVWPNVFAPEWMGFTPPVSGVSDIETDLILPMTLTSGQVLSGSNALQLPIDSDADALLREIRYVFVGANPGALLTDMRVRLRDGDGNLVTSDYIYAADLAGSVGPVLGLRKGSVLLFELQNVGAATINAQFILKCIKRIQGPAVKVLASPYTPLYKQYSTPPPGYHDEGYSYYYEIPLTLALPARRVPLQTDNDAPFFWRATAGDGSTFFANVTLYGPSDVALQSRVMGVEAPITPYENLFPGFGAQAPNYPEIEIPVGGVVLIDAVLFPGGPATGTLKLELRGVKRYPGDQ